MRQLFYFKVRQHAMILLQNATFHTKCVSTNRNNILELTYQPGANQHIF